MALTEEQEILQRTAREFVQSRSPLSRLRALRDADTADGFSRELWTEMARLGWLGIVVPEQYGGAGLGWTDLMVVLEELGRGLVPEPMMGTVLLGATTLLLGGSEAQRSAHLPAVVAGEECLALAYQEPASRYAHQHVETRAERSGGGWTLGGQKVHVLDGQCADWFIVSARTAGAPRDAAGVSLFLVPRDARGLGIERQHRVDARGAALLRLDGVRVDAGALVGGEGHGLPLLERVLDRAAIALSAEMLGGMAACFEMTLEYLRTRKQFGVPIGSFQALKHRAARMFVELELVRSIVLAAHRALDEGADDERVRRLASAAKARCSDAFVLVGNEGVQMHGGIGMTDEHDVGFFLKRARAAEITFGDAAFHRDRVARLDGY
jgi:alkylation response protein AidB-like acyl-CoA dehydrogenase